MNPSFVVNLNAPCPCGSGRKGCRTGYAGFTTRWRPTGSFCTFWEGGGCGNSGYTQPVSFFGDGPRVPMTVVSSYARRGVVDHLQRPRADPENQ